MASTIQLKTGTGSAIPSALSQGEVGINIDNGLIYYGSGSGNVVKQLESFTHITASGNISASGGGTHVLGGNLEVYGSIRSIGSDVTLENGNITLSGDISGSSTSTGSFAHIVTEGETIEFRSAGTKIGQLKVDDTTGFSFDTGDGSDRKPVRLGSLQTKDVAVTGHITASGNISSSGNIIASDIEIFNNASVDGALTTPRINGIGGSLYIVNSINAIGHITASGAISASGTIIGTLGTAAQTNITSVGTLSDLTVSGDITANGNIVGDDTTDITNIRYIYADRLIHDGDTDTKIGWGDDTYALDVGGTTQMNVDVTGSRINSVHLNTYDTGSLALESNGGSIGDIVKFGGTSTTAGSLYYLGGNGQWASAQANAAGTATSSLAMAVGTDSDTDGMLLRGFINPNAMDAAASIGAPLYMSDTHAGRTQGSAPSSTGDIVRIVGYKYGADLIYFNPSNDFIIHA